jgi:hypothetical protein
MKTMAEYDKRYKHGLAKKHPLYGRWVGMRERCNNKNHPRYNDYGGSGIAVCQRWNNFSLFLEDMGEAPPGTSIERIDGNKGYSPENCCWATDSQQSRNRSMTVWIEFNGETLCLFDWANKLGIHYTTLKERLQKWGKEKALTTPKLINGTWQMKGITNE